MTFKKSLVNGEIQASTVRVIDQNGEQLGIISIDQALEKAKASGLDLVEVAPHEKPPVCKILDYGKFRFSKSKKKNKPNSARRAKQQLKEVKFRPNIDVGDYQVKLNKLLNFLKRGDKVKITVMFRGREMLYQNKGIELMQSLEQDVEGFGVVEFSPKQEGKQLLMIIVPKLKKKRS